MQSLGLSVTVELTAEVLGPRLLLLAAYEFAQSGNPSRRSRVALRALLDALFAEHFLLPLNAPPHPVPEEAPSSLVQRLLLMCNHDIDQVQRVYRDKFFRPIVGWLVFLYGLMTARKDSLEDLAKDLKCRSFMEAFLDKLVRVWHATQLRTISWGPMPWSKRSRQEGIPPPPESFDRE